MLSTKGAPFVIAHGMLTLEELSVMGVPSIIMYDNENAEKANNAKIAERLGLGYAIDVSEAFDKEAFIRAIKNMPVLHKKITPLNNGVEAAVVSLWHA